MPFKCDLQRYNEEVILRLASNNPRNFSFTPPQLLLAAFGSGKFQVEYIPSSLNEVGLCTLNQVDP